MVTVMRQQEILTGTVELGSSRLQQQLSNCYELCPVQRIDNN